MAVVPPAVTIGSFALPVAGTPVVFATSAAATQFDSLDVYVDASLAGNAQIKWQLYAIVAGGGAPTIRTLIAQSLYYPSNFGTYLPFNRIDMIEGAQYQLVGITSSGSAAIVKAGLIGYNRQANVAGGLPPDYVGATQPLVYGVEVSFGSIAVYHTRLQAQVNGVGVANSDSSWTVIGTITDGGGNSISSAIARGGYSGSAIAPGIVLQSLPYANGIVGGADANSFASDTRGATSYELFGRSTNPAYNNVSNVSASLVGFDIGLSF